MLESSIQQLLGDEAKVRGGSKNMTCTARHEERRLNERGRYMKNIKVSGCGQVKSEKVRCKVSTTTVCPTELDITYSCT